MGRGLPRPARRDRQPHLPAVGPATWGVDLGAVGEQAMRRMIVSLALALAAAATVEAGYRVVRLTDVIVLAREGVSDRTIVSFLESRELAFVVGTDEILRLRDAGAGEELIRYLVERTAPRDSYASDPYADRAPYPDYGRSPYHEPGYHEAYIGNG